MTKKPNVALFVTCLVDLYRPRVGFAAIALLESAGCVVTVPESQTCCGQPAYNSGDSQGTQTIARHTIAAFESFDYIVAPSGSCAAMLKEHYPTLFNESDGDWLARSTAMAEKVFELTSFLNDIMPIGEKQTAPFDFGVTYHDSCSGLRELGIKKQPRKLLRDVSGVSVAEMDDTEVCCGFGGTFCVKFPDISARMVSDKSALVDKTGAEVLLGGDLGCLLNIGGRLDRLGSDVRVYHVAEVLAGMADTAAIGKKE